MNEMTDFDYDDLKQRAQHSQAFGLGVMSLDAGLLIELIDAARTPRGDFADELRLAEQEIDALGVQLDNLETANDLLQGEVEELEKELGRLKALRGNSA